MLCSPYHCFDCGGLGVTNDSCPLHRTCYRHRQTNPQGIPACRHCPVAASAAPAIGLLPLRDLLYRLVINTATTPPHHQAPSVRQACRLVLRTHSDLHLDPLTAQSPWEAVWHATDMGCSLLGGTFEPSPTQFMTNRFTWVCPSNPAGELADLRQATTAVCASTGPARATLLVHDTPDMRREISLTGHPARAHIIAVAKPHTVELQNSGLLLSQLGEQATNTSPLLLVLVENHTAPGLALPLLAKALAKANLTPTDDPWPWAYTSIPPDSWEGPVPPLLPRNHPLLRPSQSWFRGDLAPATSAATQLSPP